MNRKMEFAAAAIVAAAILGIYFFRQGGNGPSPSTGNEKLLALLANASGTLSIGTRSRTSQCKVRGPLPDPGCTPGAIFAAATPAKICISGYTKTVRNVSAGMKALIYSEYGLSYPQPTGVYEADHLIPLELGGSNDIANLFPEAANPTPGFHEKDLVENYLHGEVCAGRADLGAAQKQIANDWLAVYNAIAPDELDALRAEIQSWLN